MNSKLQKTTLVSVMITAFLTPFMGSSFNLAIPSIGKEFTASTLTLGWMVTGYILSSAALLLPFGRLADVLGRKKVFLSGLGLFAASTLLCGIAWSARSLIAIRIIQGVSGAMIFSTGMAILISVYPPSGRGKALGMTVACTYIGLSLGPVIGGFMTYHLGWRSIFFFTAALGIVVFLFTLLRLQGEWKGGDGERFNVRSCALYAAGLSVFLYAVSSVMKSYISPLLLIAGILLLLLFLRRESHVRNPILQIGLFRRNPAFAFSNLAALINYSATFAVGFIMSVYLQVILGYDARAAGLVLLCQPIIMALFSPVAGALSDRVEPRIVASIGMGVSTLGLIVFVFLMGQRSIPLLASNLSLLGFGFALFSSPNSNAIMGSVDRSFYGIASSALATMRMVGQALSMATLTLLMSIYVGSLSLLSTDPVLLIKSCKLTFAVFAVISFIGIFASLARGDMHGNSRGEYSADVG